MDLSLTVDNKTNSLENVLINKMYSLDKNLFMEYAEISHNIVILLTPTLNIQFLNKAAEKAIDNSRLNVIGQGMGELCDDPTFLSLLRNTSSQDHQTNSPNIKTSILRPNGDKRFLEISVSNILDSKGKLEAIVIWGQDTTEDILDSTIEKSVGLYLNAIFSHLPVAVFWKDENSVFQGCNEYLSKLSLLSSPEEIIGKTDFDLPWDANESRAYKNDDMTIIEKYEPRFNIIETQTRCKSNKVTICTSKVPLYNANNQVLGTAGFFCDISLNGAANLVHLSNRYITDSFMTFRKGEKYFLTHENKIFKLSAKQAECLTHLAMGKTNKEIASTLNCAPCTTETYINNLKRKLELTSTSKLIDCFWNNPLKWDQ